MRVHQPHADGPLDGDRQHYPPPARLAETIDRFGPPGLADKLQHKLAGYDWNLAETYWGNLRVHEIYPEHIARSLFNLETAVGREKDVQYIDVHREF